MCARARGWVHTRVLRGCGCRGTGLCLRACSHTYSASNEHTPYCLRPLWHPHIFRHYLINGAIFGKKSPNIKCVFSFSLQLLCKTFLILELSRQISGKKAQISNFIKIRPVGARLFHTDWRTDRHEGNSRFSQFCEGAWRYRVEKHNL